MSELEDPDRDTLHERAYDAFDRGRLREASRLFALLLQREPDTACYHYMQGLVHKYLRDWPVSLHHNLRSQALRDERDEASLWNAGIAATALGDWAQARQQWKACGISIPEGDGPIDMDLGVVSIRLNPWNSGETLYAKRIDVVRSRLLNVPLPESGYRCDDIVLHDGARTGERALGDRCVPVFNALARLVPSGFRTFTAFVSCESQEDVRALDEARGPGILEVEDWTESITRICLRCSYGAPHRHATPPESGDWQPERSLGIAAQSRHSVVRLLENWQAKGRGRHVDAIETRECEPPEPEDGHVWWDSPVGEEKDEKDQEPPRHGKAHA